jgi:four helix bundle protein
MRDYRFDFEQLDVYKMALEFANKVFDITKKFDREIQYSLGDQFRRASLSICNNIAEGSGRSTQSSKGQFYGYALDSARECVPMITLSIMQQQIDKQDEERLRDKCISICNMLGKLKMSTKRPDT